MASKGDESCPGVGKRLEDCECHLHGKHLFGMLSPCKKCYLIDMLSVIIWSLYLYILDGSCFYESCSYGICRMEEDI